MMDPLNPDVSQSEDPSLSKIFEMITSLTDVVQEKTSKFDELSDKMKKLENENKELKTQVDANKSRLSIRRKRPLADDGEGPPARQMRNSSMV